MRLRASGESWLREWLLSRGRGPIDRKLHWGRFAPWPRKGRAKPSPKRRLIERAARKAPRTQKHRLSGSRQLICESGGDWPLIFCRSIGKRRMDFRRASGYGIRLASGKLSGVRLAGPNPVRRINLDTMSVPSPCIGICTMDEVLGWCRGCGRTDDEIAEWPSAGDFRREAIWALLPKRVE